MMMFTIWLNQRCLTFPRLAFNNTLQLLSIIEVILNDKPWNLKRILDIVGIQNSTENFRIPRNQELNKIDQKIHYGRS